MDNKTIWITGASSGIGKALAIKFSKKGWNIAISARREKLLEEDDIIIFPSKTLHGTQKNANNNERISISADISIFAKESKNLEHLTPPFSEWIKFTNN